MREMIEVLRLRFARRGGARTYAQDDSKYGESDPRLLSERET
jgi:hypothetical protein